MSKGLTKMRCRSRNDQVATDYRLWLLNELKATRNSLQTLIAVACDRAEAESTVLMPGFTHLQPAQTVRWGHWLMCHCSTWQRDDQRLRDLIPRLSMLPLGSGALAGNPFLVDRQFLAKVRIVHDTARGPSDAPVSVPHGLGTSMNCVIAAHCLIGASSSRCAS